ncbi:preprotein translocase subunit SecG [Thiopseudomonas alkaliphila]|uniref:preprotein translocase subunit SecG n=1 Tax=Thiopseudomonas alkaliphila TaxID=1697053 RepID=UPI002575C915|nr:preprotein translocase subunit SecG [Thiopseudomonas alkaliphila]MDM1706918.1 preprotein translocase subunit SecG [Thiopseudomonas alkaliphila]
MLENVIIVVHLLAALGVVGFVLIQHGKGADAGASFGSGASATVFGSQGSGSFLSRTTAVLATIFFASSMVLAYYAKDRAASVSDLGVPDPSVLEVPKPAVEDVPQIKTQEKLDSADAPVVE